MLTPHEIFYLAEEVLGSSRVTAKDIVALAAFHCGSYDAPLYIDAESSLLIPEELLTPHGFCRFTPDSQLLNKQLQWFGEVFTDGQLFVMTSKIGFLPFRKCPLERYLANSDSENSLPLSQWWGHTQKFMADPKVQIKEFAAELEPVLMAAKRDRLYGYSMYITPETAVPTKTGRNAYSFYANFRLNKEAAPKHERLCRE